MILNSLPKTVRDLAYFEKKYNPLYQTIHNGMSFFTFRGTINSATTRYFGLVPTNGKQVYLWSRGLVLSEGAFNVDVIRATTYTLGEEKMTKTALNQVEGTVISSEVYSNVTAVSGETVLEYGYVDAGSGLGSSNLPSISSKEDIVKVYDSPVFLKIENLGANAATVLFNALLWEEDK